MTLWDELLFITISLYGRVLDAGCANGDYSKRLKELYPIKEVISLDIQPPNTMFCGKSFTSNFPKGNFIQGDIIDLHMFSDSSFDSVFCWQTLEHTSQPSKALKEFYRVLKRPGLLMVAMPTKTCFNTNHPWDIGTPMEHRTFWDPTDLEKATKQAGFLIYSDTYIDQTGCQNRLFSKGRVVKGINQ